MPSKEKSTKYKDVGIDIKKIKRIQNQIGKNIEKTHQYLDIGKVISGFGHYAGLIEIGDKVMAMHTDGVGTKILIAQLTEKYDTIGIDCIAMNVNDIICVGSKPLGYLSYIALKKTNDLLLKEITKGLVKGAKLSNIAIVGGETAILPDIITGKGKDYNFDLAGMILGILDNKKKIILGNKIKDGDLIIGINSSGLHSNGYTLARKVLLDKYSINEKPEYLETDLGNELLKPTAIYSKTILKVIDEFDTNVIHGLSHITGGAFTKLKRLNSSVDYILDNLPQINGIFKQIMIDGKIDITEMYKTFNMGIGFCIIVSKSEAENIINIINKDNFKCQVIGKIKSKGNGNTFIKNNNDLLEI
ncbi:MAG: phosphoribosylformylglycinamidine cyclo-ligase [Thermoproteota archaeon]|nr:phosphoribosylformylglycinamidine cyclo-ligase [Thermoproteota archaeon]